MQADFLKLKVHLLDELDASLRLASGEDNTGRLALVLGADISPMISALCGMNWLQTRGVQSVFKLEADAANTVPECECTAVVYLIRAHHVEAMCRQVTLWMRHGARKEFVCFFVPRVPTSKLHVIEQHGLHERLKVAALELALLPLDDDLCSLERPDLFTDSLLHGDRLSLAHAVAESLALLQQIYGPLPRILAKGHTSKRALNVLMDLNRQMGIDAVSAAVDEDDMPSASKIAMAVLIDRELDPLSPFVTQLTYEGLIDEVLGIHSGFVEIDSSLVADASNQNQSQTSTTQSTQPPPPPVNKRQKYSLNADDELYAQIRDKSFSESLNCLASITSTLKQRAQQRLGGESVAQLHKYVAQLPGLLEMRKSITAHVNIASLLTSFTSNDPDFHRILKAENEQLNDNKRDVTRELLEDLLIRQRPMEQVLRLFVLYSLHNGTLLVSTQIFVSSFVDNSYSNSRRRFQIQTF
jgi:hypothetical protein